MYDDDTPETDDDDDDDETVFVVVSISFVAVTFECLSSSLFMLYAMGKLAGKIQSFIICSIDDDADCIDDDDDDDADDGDDECVDAFDDNDEDRPVGRVGNTVGCGTCNGSPSLLLLLLLMLIWLLLLFELDEVVTADAETAAENLIKSVSLSDVSDSN